MSWRDMPYTDALASLRRAHQLCVDQPDLRRALACMPDIGESVLAFLNHALDPPQPDEPPLQEIWELVPLLFKNLDDTQVADLLGDVLFRARQPAVYGLLAQGVRWRVPPAIAESALLAQLLSADPRRRSNAVDLAYFLFAEDPRYRLSEAGRAAVAASAREH
ncbi:MAG: hypothetical protein H0T79_06520 [Deltaproteobacteria bacterium]|nr:hypothetical protein [Deltaproteobacteria bacterium]